MPNLEGQMYEPASQAAAVEPIWMPTAEEIKGQDIWNNCVVRSVVSGVMGGGLGVLMGLFFGALDNPIMAEEMTARQQIVYTAKQMGRRSISNAKTFAVMGLIFSAAECVIEKARAKHDTTNTAVAGCVTGGALAVKGRFSKSDQHHRPDQSDQKPGRPISRPLIAISRSTRAFLDQGRIQQQGFSKKNMEFWTRSWSSGEQISKDIVVCEICGSSSRPELIANCARCNAYEHCYCMQVVTYVIPHEWYCAGCQEYANGCPKPSQSGQTQLQNPWHGCDSMKERETVKLNLSHSNVVNQIDPRSSNKFGNAKVKFISSEEVASLSRERPSYVRSRFAVQRSKVHPPSPPNTKHSSNLKCVSPSRSDTQVQALKRCAVANHDQTKIVHRSYLATQQRRVHPASPPSVKQPSNMKSISPSRSDMQVQALKQCAAASRDQAKIEGRPDFAIRQRQVHPASPPHVKQLANMKCISSNRTETQVHSMKQSAATYQDQAKIDGISMKWDTRAGGSMSTIHRCRTSELVKVNVDSMFEQEAREMKIVKAHEGEINSEIEDGPRETGTLCASDGDTVSKSETESLNQNRDVILCIDSSVEYTRRPPRAICWKGCFHVLDAGANLNLGEFKAQFPSKVSSKVYDIVKMIPNNLQLQLLPRMNDWPKSFEITNPVYEDIGLFFFSNEPDGHEKHSDLLEASSNYVLRAYIDGIKLLIYSSEVLPPDSQWIDGENYLWGVFVRSKGKRDPRQFGSTTT